MSSVLDQMNLTPQERRLVVGGGAVLFLVLNLWFIWPHFDELSAVRQELDQARLTLSRYQMEVDRLPTYQARRDELQQRGAEVLSEDQTTALMTYIISQARRSGLNQRDIAEKTRSTTNDESEFFEERAIGLKIEPTDPENLVDFLVAIAASDLAIRIRELDLTKNARTPHLLSGSMELVATFQKSPPAPTETAPSTTETNALRTPKES